MTRIAFFHFLIALCSVSEVVSQSFKCGDGAHIPLEWVCDGQIDCLTDKLDELNCGSSPAPKPNLETVSNPHIQPGPGEFEKKKEIRSPPQARIPAREPVTRKIEEAKVPEIKTTRGAEAGLCPPSDILHRICSKTLTTSLKDLINETPTAPSILSLNQVFKSCLSYATYNGCLIALAPNKECLPHQTISALLNTTYSLFCNTYVLGNMSSHATCLAKVREEGKTKVCQERFLGNAILPSAKFEVCEMVTNFYQFSQCIQESVEKLCDLGAMSFLEDIQQAFVHELLKNHCEEISQLRLFQIQAEEERRLFEKNQFFTTVIAASQSLDFQTDPPAGETPLPFMSLANDAEHKRSKIEKLGSSKLTTVRRRVEKRIFPRCNPNQEESAKACFKWVASLPHTGTNLPPNQWLMEMANPRSVLMGDTCTALRIYERCLEETVFRKNGRCSFRSWVPVHVEIAQNVLCDAEVLELLPQFQSCLLNANATLDMDVCADMDIEIVKLIRVIYDSPGERLEGEDTTCSVLSKLRESYECISDVTFETCGRDILYVIGKIRMNVVRIAIEEGCTVCA